FSYIPLAPSVISTLSLHDALPICLDDALLIRNNILAAFERAETEQSASERERLMTIVVVGGGPTGIELAGAFAELARFVLRKDLDRKSTRLNSSHLGISYAVFCLK